MSNNYRRGYRAERRVEIDVGGKRLGRRGEADVLTDFHAYEIKMRKKLPKFLKDCYAEGVKHCPRGKHPIVVLKEGNTSWRDALVVMRYKNFLSWLHKKEK